MMLSGSVPYLDFWDNKPPFIYFLYNIILKIFGHNNFASINYFALFFYLASTIFLFLIIKKLLSTRAASAVVIVYPFIANLFIGRDAINPNTEIYMLSFALLSLLIYFKLMDKKSYFMLIPGLLLGISSVFKQPSVFYFPIMIFMLFIADKKSIKKNIYRSIYLFLGICVVWLIISFYFFTKNSLWDFWFSVFGFNFLYCGDIAKHTKLIQLIKIYAGFLCSYPVIFPFYIFGIIRSCYLLIQKSTERKIRFSYFFILLWHLVDIAGVSQRGLFYYHYFIQLIPSMTVIMVIPCLEMIKNRKKTLYLTVISIFISVLVYQSLTERKIFQFYDPCKYEPPQKVYSLRNKIVDVYGKKAMYFPYFRSIKNIDKIKHYVKIIKKKTDPKDSIFIWSNMSEMYLLAERKPASRFIYVSFITGQCYGLRNLFYTETKPLERYLKKIEKLLFEDFSANSPEIILVSFHKKLGHTEFFWNYLNENYDLMEPLNNLPLSIYIRKKD